MAHGAIGVVRVAAIPLLMWSFPRRFEPPRRGLWPWPPLLIQGGEQFRDRTALIPFDSPEPGEGSRNC